MKKFLCVALSIIMLFAFASCGGRNEGGTDVSEKEGLTSFTTVTLDGENADESIFKGKKVTMVNIWATFCGPCIGEMPDLQKLHEDYADRDFQVVGIVCDVYGDRNLDTAKDIVKDTGVKYVSLLPSDSLNEAKLNSVTSVPETFFVDETGAMIAGPYIGSRSYSQWAEVIEGVLAK